MKPLAPDDGSEAGDIGAHEDAEDQEGDDLPDDAGHHEVVADLLLVVVVRCRGGDASARALEDEGEEVAADEDPGVIFGAEEAERGTQVADEVFESQVHARGHEGGRDDQAADLDFEACVGPWVVVQDHPADVPCSKVSDMSNV